MFKRKQPTKIKKKKVINLILPILLPSKKERIIKLFIKRNIRSYIISLLTRFK